MPIGVQGRNVRTQANGRISFLLPNQGMGTGRSVSPEATKSGLWARFVEGHHNGGGRDLHLPGHVQQIAKDCFRLGVAVLSADTVCRHAVERTGHEAQLHVEVYLHANLGDSASMWKN